MRSTSNNSARSPWAFPVRVRMSHQILQLVLCMSLKPGMGSNVWAQQPSFQTTPVSFKGARKTSGRAAIKLATFANGQQQMPNKPLPAPTDRRSF